jgi:zinc/manganese transport system substrate-binding protein
MRLRLLVWLLALGAMIHAPLARAELKVFASVPEWAALVKELGGDKVTVSLAIGPLQDPDMVEVKPTMLNQVKEASLVICTGPLEQDWLPTLLTRAGNPKVRPGQPGYMAAAEFVRLMAEPAPDPTAKAHAHSAGHPHIQTDARNIRAVATQLGRRLARLDQANAPYYAERAKSFLARLDDATKRWQVQAAPLKGIKVVAQHDNMNYMWAWLGIEQVGTVELIGGGTPPAHLARIIDLIGQQKVRMVINAVYEDPKSAMFVAERAKVPLLRLPFTVGGNDASKDLFGLFDDMIAQMLKAVGQGG